jgi:translation initiation factor 4E
VLFCFYFISSIILSSLSISQHISILQFWSIFNNILPSSQLALNSNYHLFKEGIEPMWEDPQNKDGGKFVLSMPKKDTREGRGDEWWLYTVLAVIGETMDLTGEEVCGCVVSIRKSQDRIALWLRSSDKKRCTEVGARWKKALEVSNKTSLKYQAHRDGELLVMLFCCC